MDLLTPDEIDAMANPSSPLGVTLEWARNFLAKPDPDLGRSGNVCPFVPTSLATNRMRLVAVESDPQNQEEMEGLVDQYRREFLDLVPKEGKDSITKTIVIVFPRVSDELAPILIDEIQARLKPAFVDDGLMLGQFHSQSKEPGLHNEDFRPLRSPIPLLAIRFMVGGDIPFLKRQTDDIALRLRFLGGYVRGCDTYKWPVKWRREAVEDLLELAEALERWATS